jgi:hypothetical protein
MCFLTGKVSANRPVSLTITSPAPSMKSLLANPLRRFSLAIPMIGDNSDSSVGNDCADHSVGWLRSQVAKAVDCKSTIPGSNPGGASWGHPQTTADNRRLTRYQLVS